MLKTILPAEMKRVETRVMQNTSITGEALMQRAAAHVAGAAKQYCTSKGGITLCLCGNGNNGGDGFAAMRMLADANPAFRGSCWVLPGALSQDAQREMNRLKEKAGLQVSIRFLQEEEHVRIPESTDCIIDALFGTGLSRPLEGLAQKLCAAVNESGRPVVAVDIPSGLNGATGEIMGEAVRADRTVTFHRPKPGLYLGQGPDYAGEVITADIGLRTPEAAALDDADGMDVLEKKDLAWLLPARRKVTHKGSYGRVLLFAGSRGMAGAAAIGALAALRTGAGLVTVACPDAVVDIVQGLCPCATCLPLPEDAEEAWTLLEPALRRADAIGAGCGLGQGSWAANMNGKLTAWLAQNEKPAVLDADALNLIAKTQSHALGSRTFVTPHPAEAARLTGESIETILADMPGSAQKIDAAYGACTVLKGTCSILCAGEGMAVNPFGTPAMAKGGSGDALTGIMAALLAGCAAGAYAMNDLQLMQTACALHGIAGEMTAARFGERGMLATDLCSCIGLVEAEKEPVGWMPLSNRQKVTVVVEHPAGSRDESDERMVYWRNCGYVQQVLDEQNEWQDACILPGSKPLEWFDGEVMAEAVIDGRSVWIVCPKDWMLSREQLIREVSFLGEVQSVAMFW